MRRTPIVLTGLGIMLLLVQLSLSRNFLQAAPPILSLQLTQEFGWHRVIGTADTGQVYTILGSSNLSDWNVVATLLDRPGNTNPAGFSFLDPASTWVTQRFYQLATQSPTVTNDWKNQSFFPNDPFVDTNIIPGNPRPIKFTIDLSDPYRVYYQNSTKFPFHYDFAVARLAGFSGLSRSEFDSISLYTNNQQLVLGTLLLPPALGMRAAGIQFVGLDVYPPERIRDWFRLVRSTIVDAAPTTSVFYLPALEQAAAAEAARTFFATNGIEVSSADIWVKGDVQIYATGWALGRLKFFRALDIRTAFNEGRLLPQDILVTDGIPAEIPMLAGLITFVPATPNAHAAILARSYGIPFVYLADPAERERVRGLADREVVLRVRNVGSVNPVKIVDVEGTLSPEFRAELLALKAPPAVNFVPITPFGAISSPTEILTSADIRHFGGKASNFGVLRRVLPTNSPPAIAFSFDLWSAFLDQTLPSGETLRATIQQRLAGFSYPPDIVPLRANLEAVRDLIRKTARFTPAQQQAITNSLVGFASGRNIRFRSSTNLEDTEAFIGAGLYDSYSGCLADDLDGDSTGPSICDPTEPDERGVFRAIQRVYASFYNDDAFIERLRLRVNEAEVGMAVLVHYSFPDSIEMANGVATLSVRPFGAVAVLNTQVGAESVTNPDGTSLPEIVQIDHYSFGDFPTKLQDSTRVDPSDPYVLEWESEYRQLMTMLLKVANGYSAQFTNKQTYQLDFEYKKVQPGVLEIKQVREIPSPPATNLPAPYLINEPASFVVFQGESSAGPFDVHYLKSKLRAQTLNTRLDRTDSSLLSEVVFSFLEGTNIVVTSGLLTNWPVFSHQVNGSATIDSWTYGNGLGKRTFSLRMEGARPGGASSSDAIRFLSDFTLSLSATLATPVPEIGPDGTLSWTTNLGTGLVLERAVVSKDPHGGISIAKNGRSAGGTFRTPYEDADTIIKTIPVLQWIGGALSGFTSQPIPLSNYYALTFHPEHHNFSNHFIIDPSLEPSLSSAERAEFAAQNIRLVYGHSTGFGPTGRLFILGFDNKVQEVK